VSIKKGLGQKFLELFEVIKKEFCEFLEYIKSVIVRVARR